MASDSWVEIRIGNANNRDAIIAGLFDLGSQGVQDAGNEIVTYFPETTDIQEIRNRVAAADPGCEITVRPAELPDAATLHGRFARQTIGLLTVSPPWLADGLDPATTVIVDPAMGFGTGEHPTTRSVLRLMQTIPLKGMVVADLGAGSGILSIAAARLGAEKVVAIELDEDASGNAIENIETNGMRDCVHFIHGDAFAILPLIAPVDIVLANILSSVLVDLLPVIRDSLRASGKVILSGILVSERPQMMDAIRSGYWQLEREDVEGEWWSALISRA